MIGWVIFAVLAAAAAAMLALPVMRQKGPAGSRTDFDLAVFRRQLAELDHDVAGGALAPGEARAARIEIERRILSAADTAEQQRSREGRRSAIFAAILGVPLLSVAIYAWIGSPDEPDQPFAARTVPAPAPMPADVAAAIDALAARLRENPDNLDGWILLGRSYANAARFDDSAQAFENAAALAPRNPDIAAAWGEALFYAAGGIVTPAAARQFDAALALDPTHTGARYYSGMAAMQAGDPTRAFAIWTALAEDAAPEAPWLPEVQERLRTLASELGVEPPPVALRQPPQPDGLDTAALTDLPPEQQEAAIAGMVARLEARLMEQPGDVEGWRRLGRAKLVLGDLPAAAAAYTRAADLEPDDLPTLEALAEVERRRGPDAETVPDAAQQVYRRILALEPDHPAALWFSGLAASRAGRAQEAAALWERLHAQLPPDSEEHELLAARIAELRTAN